MYKKSIGFIVRIPDKVEEGIDCQQMTVTLTAPIDYFVSRSGAVENWSQFQLDMDYKKEVFKSLNNNDHARTCLI